MSMTELEHPAKHTAWSCRLGRGQAPPLRIRHVRQTVARLMSMTELNIPANTRRGAAGSGGDKPRPYGPATFVKRSLV